MLFLVAALALAVLYDASMPMRSGLLLWGGGVLVLVLVIVLLQREAARPKDRGGKGKVTTPSRSKARLVILSLLGAIVLSCMVSDWPRRLGFAISRPALDARVQAYHRNPLASLFKSPDPSWAGIYRVVEVTGGQEGRVRVLIADGLSMCIDKTGFEYDPTDSGTGWPFTKLARYWYTCEE